MAWCFTDFILAWCSTVNDLCQVIYSWSGWPLTLNTQKSHFHQVITNAEGISFPTRVPWAHKAKLSNRNFERERERISLVSQPFVFIKFKKKKSLLKCKAKPYPTSVNALQCQNQVFFPSLDRIKNTPWWP